MLKRRAFLRNAGSFLAAGCAGSLASGCVRRSSRLVLRLGHGLDVSHPVHKAMERMAEELDFRSDHKIEVRIYPNEQLGAERDLIEQVQLGAIDMVKTSTSPLEGFVPLTAIFSLPYVFRDEEHYWKTIQGPIGRRLLDAGEEQYLKGLCYYDAGSRSFYSKSRPIEKPADLQGLKIRVQNSRTSMKMIESMGGSPTPIPFGELYTALEQGVVDGAENNPPSFHTSRHYEVCKYYSLDEHSRVPDIVLMSTFTWKRLSQSVQQWVAEAAEVSAEFQRELWGRKTTEALEQVQAAGVRIIRPDKAPFQQAVQELYREYNGTPVGDLLAEISRVK